MICYYFILIWSGFGHINFMQIVQFFLHFVILSIVDQKLITNSFLSLIRPDNKKQTNKQTNNRIERREMLRKGEGRGKAS